MMRSAAAGGRAADLVAVTAMKRIKSARGAVAAVLAAASGGASVPLALTLNTRVMRTVRLSMVTTLSERIVHGLRALRHMRIER